MSEGPPVAAVLVQPHIGLQRGFMNTRTGLASERRDNNCKDFYLTAKASIWPRLSYMRRVCLTVIGDLHVEAGTIGQVRALPLEARKVRILKVGLLNLYQSRWSRCRIFDSCPVCTRDLHWHVQSHIEAVT